MAVLSNNDGCIVARSNEIKALGIPMGAPMFQYKELLEKTHGISFTNFVAIFSDSNNSKQKIIAYYRDIYFSSE